MSVTFSTQPREWISPRVVSGTTTIHRKSVPVSREVSGWRLPSVDLLKGRSVSHFHHDRAHELRDALTSLDIHIKEISETSVAPQAVRYELVPDQGTRMRSFRGIEADLMQLMGIETVRIQAPTPGKTTVGIEIPREDRATVDFYDMMVDPTRKTDGFKTTVGVDLNDDPVTLNIAAMPHLLIAGRSGGGKSVLVHDIILSALMTYTPAELELTLIDTKAVEGEMYEGIPHGRVVYDARSAVTMLWAAVEQMEATYVAMREYGCRTLDELNEILRADGREQIPRRLIVVEECADLMMQSKSRVESAMIHLGQKGRAAGFHVIIATQSPRANVITGLLKANLPARIALATSSALDSRIILESAGAETLLGRGDALLDAGDGSPLTRFQAAWAPTSDIQAVVQFWVEQARERETVTA